MISTVEANENTKFFSHNWTVTLPSYPFLKYRHITLSHLDSWFPVFYNPLNHPYDENAHLKVWDEVSIAEWRSNASQKYTNERAKFIALQMLIELDGEIVGGGSYNVLPTGDVNCGIMLAENARGKGIGKLSVQVIIQLGRRMGVEKLEVVTMKTNKPMQGLMASLNILGREEIREAPGRGVIGEILYPIPEKVDWADVDMQIEFGDQAFEMNTPDVGDMNRVEVA